MSYSLSDQIRNSRARYVWDDWSLAKPREECQGFTFTMAEIPKSYPWRNRAEEAQGKVLPKLEAVLNGKKPRASNRGGWGCRISADRQKQLYNEAMANAPL